MTATMTAIAQTHSSTFLILPYFKRTREIDLPRFCHLCMASLSNTSLPRALILGTAVALVPETQEGHLSR